VRVGDLVASLPAFRHRDYDPAAPQAREVVRDVGAGELEFSGELGGVSGKIEQAHQDPRSGFIGHGAAEAIDDIEARSNGQHTMTIQWALTNIKVS